MNITSRKIDYRTSRLSRLLPGKPESIRESLICRATLSIVCSPLLLVTACHYSNEGPPASNNTTAPGLSIQPSEIVERVRNLDNSRDSHLKSRVTIEEADGTTREIQFSIYKKRRPDGGHIILVEFIRPEEERDRSSIISVSPTGEIEATRYAQSTNNFITTTGATSEDSLFGMTLQELVDGQLEKYDFSGRPARSESQNSSEVYRVEGELRDGEDSKFGRLVLFVSPSDFTVSRAEFYDHKGSLTRRVNVHRTERVDGYWTRMRWEIENLERGKHLEFETVVATYDQDLGDALFTREQLKKKAMR